MLAPDSTPPSRSDRGVEGDLKVIVNEVPIQQFYALPYDRWEGYAAERERLLRFLQANVKNVVFLTTDTHANLVNEVRYKTLGGAPESSGIWEVVTGPVATNTFAKEIDGYLGQKGAGTAIGALFFKPAPPNGVGMRCAALDTYSRRGDRTAKRLTVAMKDAQGSRARGDGVACPPLVLAAQPRRRRATLRAHGRGTRRSRKSGGLGIRGSPGWNPAGASKKPTNEAFTTRLSWMSQRGAARSSATRTGPGTSKALSCPQP